MDLGARIGSWASNDVFDGMILKVNYSGDKQIFGSYNSNMIVDGTVEIDWGDGTSTECATGTPPTHSYGEYGEYVLKIGKEMTYGRFQESRNIIGIIQFGVGITSLDYSFYSCNCLTGVFPEWGRNITSAKEAFRYLTRNSCVGFTGAWTTDQDLLMPSKIISHSEAFNKSGIDSLFYSSWGGTRTA